MTDGRTTRIAVVTGAGQGLGRAVAVALDAAGITVAAVGRTKSKLDDTIKMLGGRGVAVAADLTDPAQVRTAFKTAADQLGGVDILVNCAAEYGPFPFDEASDEAVTNLVTQSFLAPLYCMRAALPLMRQRGAGDIVNISSKSADMPQPFMTVYGGSKAGLETVSQGLRMEFRDEDFRFIVCQIGLVQDTVREGKRGLDEYGARAFEAWEKSGINAIFSSRGTSPKAIADAITHAVTAPREVYIQTIQIEGVLHQSGDLGLGPSN